MGTEFDHLQQRLWQQQQHDLLEEYEAVQNQIGHTLDETQRLRLGRKALELEKQLRLLEEKLVGKTAVSPSHLSPPPSIVSLIDQIAETFNLSELTDLCLRLSLEMENLAGQTRAEKARELVLTIQRQQRQSELIAELQRLRPKVNWDV